MSVDPSGSRNIAGDRPLSGELSRREAVSSPFDRHALILRRRPQDGLPRTVKPLDADGNKG
jgi:hypothetical protein